jgi:hypothetical protein
MMKSWGDIFCGKNITLMISKTGLLSLLSLTSHAAEIKKSSISILNSETLPGNLLPNFLFQQGSIEGGSIGVKTGGGRGTPKPFIPDGTEVAVISIPPFLTF